MNYDAITIGLEVEFLVADQVCSGFVRYKGPVNGKDGLWCGIEAKQPVGFCDGRLNGRTYFKCPDNFGLFLAAEELRLAKRRPNSTRSKNLYKSLNQSECDEVLFKKHSAKEEFLICIDQDYLNRAKSAFKYGPSELYLHAPSYATRENLVYLKAKKDTKSADLSSSMSASQSFHHTSSIPKEFMPKDELKIYTKLAWSYKNKDLHLPRNPSTNNTFDSFNKSRSNYLDPTAK